jgi:L-ascorbate metabolism protein UlaG (beta-lactamase superfamily)
VTPVAPGDAVEVAGVRIQAVPAYNIVEERLDKHPKTNNWVGYVLTLGGRDYYHAGDTDHVPELDSIRAAVTFLPIGGTFTMEAEEAGGLARAIGPELAVPMHYGFVVGSRTDAERFAAAAKPVVVRTLQPVRPFQR